MKKRPYKEFIDDEVAVLLSTLAYRTGNPQNVDVVEMAIRDALYAAIPEDRYNEIGYLHTLPVRQGKYIDDKGLICPECGRAGVNMDEIESQEYGASADCDCSFCGATWTDIYELAGFDNLEKRDEEVAAADGGGPERPADQS